MTERAPGDVNAHTHLYSGLAPFGMPPPKPPPENFIKILERVWWRLDRALDKESLAASARIYVAAGLLRGTTTLIDHHESPNFIEGSLDVVAEAIAGLGARGLVCYGATERNGGVEEARRGLDECARFIRENRRPLIKGAVGLHASFTVSDDTIRRAGRLCAELGAIMHVHVAEDVADVADAKRRGFKGPLERLFDLRALPRGSILAHGVHLDPAQVQRAVAAGCWLVHNPRSNQGNLVGYASALSGVARVALGTDGYPADMAEEREVLERQAKENHDPTSAIARLAAGRTLVAEIFGDDLSGDLVVRDERSRVREVFVHGEALIRDSHLVEHDINKIRATAVKQAQRLWKRMGEIQ